MNGMKKLLGTALGLLMLCGGAVGCNTGSTSANAEGLSYVSMRINPEIELVVDEDGEVVAANAINEDGETVLSELELVGTTVEEAGEAFTETATELGFIDVDAEDATVYVSADGENEGFVAELEEKLTEKINGFFDKKGIFGKVEKEELAEFEALATEWEVSLKDAKMISRILELYPEMTVEEILELSFEERLELIKDDHVKNGLPAQMRDEYKEAVDALKAEYEELFAMKKQLKELSWQLRDRELSEEERATLQAEFDALKAEYEALDAEYKAAVEALKAERRERVEEVKAEIKEHAEERRGEFEGKLQEHDDKFRENKEEIGQQIKDWRDGHR